MPDQSGPNRLWHISTAEFARALRAVSSPVFLLDETVETWQCSYFRFVQAPIADFPTLVEFAAAAVSKTENLGRPIDEWACEVGVWPIFPNRQHDLIASARADCGSAGSECATSPAWLTFDSEIIDAFEICERGAPLTIGSGSTSRHFYRTASNYYFLEVHNES